MVRPSRPTAVTHPQLHPASLRLSAMISQYRFTPRILPHSLSTRQCQSAAFGACQLAVFSGKLRSMEAEIDCKLQSNYRADAENIDGGRATMTDGTVDTSPQLCVPQLRIGVAVSG